VDQGQEPGGAGLLYHGIAALISRRHATLIDLPRLHTDDRFRERGVRGVEDPERLRFWTEEFPGYTKSLRSDAIAPILNKAGQIAASPRLRLILGQVAPRIDLSFTMNNRRILIANLAKGAIGEQAAIFWDHSSYRTCSSSRWSAAHSRQHSGSRSSCTSMNSKRSAQRRSRRFCRRHANSRRIFAWQTNTPISSRQRCDRW
jgi:hypothetical protein